MKKQFILDEIWMLTINAAFQRANIYVPGTIEKERQLFRDALKKHIIQNAEMYANPVDETQHLQNINSVITFSSAYMHLLQNASLSFGVSQKLLNLYLKYLWTLDEIKIPPPHFPVDRRIQIEMKIKSPASWTGKKFGEPEYLKIIETAKALLPSLNHKTVAELELYLFSRSASKIRKTVDY